MHQVRLALAVFCVGAAGCWSTGPVTLKLAYASSGEFKISAPRIVPCRIQLTAITDGRPDVSRSSLGDRGGGPVAAEHIPEWVGQGLNTLVGQGLATWAGSPPASGSLSDAATDTNVSAGVSIRRLYTRAVATDLEAVIVLEVTYARRDRPALQRDYRASAQKLNWFAAQTEVQDVLNRALEDAVQQMAGDLGAVCAEKPRTPTPRTPHAHVRDPIRLVRISHFVRTTARKRTRDPSIDIRQRSSKLDV